MLGGCCFVIEFFRAVFRDGRGGVYCTDFASTSTSRTVSDVYGALRKSWVCSVMIVDSFTIFFLQIFLLF